MLGEVDGRAVTGCSTRPIRVLPGRGCRFDPMMKTNFISGSFSNGIDVFPTSTLWALQLRPHLFDEQRMSGRLPTDRTFHDVNLDFSFAEDSLLFCISLFVFSDLVIDYCRQPLKERNERVFPLRMLDLKCLFFLVTALFFPGAQ